MVALAAGIEARGAIMEKDAEETCGPRRCRPASRRGYRRPQAAARSVFTAARSTLNGPRVCTEGGKELAPPIWERGGLARRGGEERRRKRARLLDEEPWRRCYVVLAPGAPDLFVPKR
jgi:hypothetical protein